MEKWLEKGRLVGMDQGCAPQARERRLGRSGERSYGLMTLKN